MSGLVPSGYAARSAWVCRFSLTAVTLRDTKLHDNQLPP